MPSKLTETQKLTWKLPRDVSKNELDSCTYEWASSAVLKALQTTSESPSNRATQEFILVAKFLTKRVLNTEAIVRTFSPLWRAKNDFKVCDAGDHIMLFVFDNAEEVNKILSSEPWSFDRHLVLLQRLESSTSVQALKLDSVSIWVQVHHILVCFLNRGVAEDLCKAIRAVDKSAKDTEVDRGSFFRVRVRIDISLPLCRGRVLALEDGEECWVSFKYERLPNICYWCGCLDHTDRDCEKWIESDGTLDSREREYGPWIRDAPTQVKQKPVVVVPGFYEARKKGGLMSNTQATKIQKPTREEHWNQADQTNTAQEEEALNSDTIITEPLNTPEFSMVEMAEGLIGSNRGNNGENKCENYGDLYGNNGIPLEDQILEIDSVLNGVEITETMDISGAAKNKEVHVESSNNAALRNIPANLVSGLEVNANHVEKGLETGADHVELLHSKFAEPNRGGEPDVHGGVSSREEYSQVEEGDFDGLVIEGDNSNAIHAISSSVENTSLYGNVVEDIRHLIRGLLWSDICCIRRGGNRVAHALAQYARHALDEDLYWVEESPPPALDALYHDRLSI
ncbi:hypothetical protein SO802_013448 [Lithocarpus litseifolius]|uniref:CCHC-type domain-containing protein n=1 Tax=Lithocarpus litseifolius TaxID=425828 RepID=A0AAW2D5L6_9ROSI